VGCGSELLEERTGQRVERRAVDAHGGDAIGAPIDGEVLGHAGLPRVGIVTRS
jgi:hypothetical protein